MPDRRLRTLIFWLRFMIPAWAVVRGCEWVAPAADRLRWVVDWWVVVRWGVVR